jgi:hypothetical protein
MAWDYTNDYSSTILAYLSGAGSITVVSVTGLPASGMYFILKIDNEYFLCTSYTGLVLTVTGGQASSTPANHSLGATITGCWIVPQVLDGIKSDIIGSAGNVVGPASATDGNLVVFDGTTGKLVKDGGARGNSGHVTILPWAYSSIGQGTFVIVSSSVDYLGWEMYNSTNTNGDNISYMADLAPGTYTFLLIHHIENNRGKIDIQFNESVVGTIDAYSAGAVNIARSLITGIVVSGGITTIKLIINGSSGSGHYMSPEIIALWRTA